MTGEHPGYWKLLHVLNAVLLTGTVTRVYLWILLLRLVMWTWSHVCWGRMSPSTAWTSVRSAEAHRIKRTGMQSREARRDGYWACDELSFVGLSVSWCFPIGCLPKHRSSPQLREERTWNIVGCQHDLLFDTGNSHLYLQEGPLHLACGKGRTDVVSVLLDAGADVSLQDASGNNAMDRAISKNQEWDISGPSY